MSQELRGITELGSETHRQFRAAHEGHRPHAGLDPARASTGVVWCTERATEHGYSEDPSSWANLGQGAPEADDEIEGSFPRPTSIPITSASREYGPTAGIKPLRAAVARMYNEHYRRGKPSQYTWENVCIVPGGRAGLIRIAAILGNSYLSFPIPDYSAYSEMLTLFKNVCTNRSPSERMVVANLDRSLLFPFPSLKMIITISTPTKSPKKSPVVLRCF